MKNFISLLIITVTIFACTKESSHDNATQLKSVTMNGKIQENFEYNNDGQLIKDDAYHLCNVPSDEVTYMYKNKQLDSVKSVTRSLYSSSTAICNPLLGEHSYSVFEYNISGKIIKIKKENTTIDNVYNSNGQVEKQTVNGGGANLYVSTYMYDTRGNLVEATDGQGGITQYEFDNKINPYFLMKRRPDNLIAFYVSPNNVIKIKTAGSAALEIKYEYNLLNLPTKMLDPNGLTYTFVYN